MIENFIWLNNYNIGNDTIDQQHRYLFDLGNLIVESSSKPILTSHIMSLFKYVREHFRDEEAMMKMNNYPHYAAQLQAHEQLLSKLNEISTKIHDETTNPREVMEFMRGYFLTHVLEMDMLPGKFLAECCQT